MAQADLVVANQSGAAFRADLNNQLQALGTNQSGPNEPSVTYAYMPWADTTAGLLKIRNAANNGWVTIGSLAEVGFGLLSRAGGTMTGALLLDDSGTASLPAAAFDGDADTGWFRKGANQIGVATGGVERGYFDATGWVGPVVGAVTTTSINGGPLAGFRNLLINGNPLINQRGYVSGTATTGANQYTLDRWRVVTSGQSITWTDSANVRTITAPAGGVEQVIEGINILSGTYTLNWTGTATATVDGAAVAKGGNVTLTGGSNCTVRFSSGTFSLAQLEPGTVATPFERRSYGQELSLSQRYYEVTPVIVGGYHTAGGYLRQYRGYSTSKRAAATLTSLGVSEALNITTGSIYADTSSTTGFRVLAQVNATGDGYITQTIAANAEL